MTNRTIPRTSSKWLRSVPWLGEATPTIKESLTVRPVDKRTINEPIRADWGAWD